jgi:hypothetical protein
VNDQLAQALTQALQGEEADPVQALLIQQLAQSADEDADLDAADLHEQLARCRRTVQRLGAEVAAANAMTEWVAQALGACPACWGLDRFCRRCLGAGLPGSSEPDAERLVEWVTPALARSGLTVIPIPPSDQPGRTITEGAAHGSG